MINEPLIRRVAAFIDGQNLFHAVRECFGYTYPNFDAKALSRKICELRGWSLTQVHFYTGVPDMIDNPVWHDFWALKKTEMGRLGITSFTRALRYRNKTVKVTDRFAVRFLAGEEKGIDVRIAVDVIRMAHHNEYDIALIFSQDQDLSEVAKEVQAIGVEQDRWIKVACAFPTSPKATNPRGINHTDWIPFDQKTYDQCLDPVDYRMKKAKKEAND